MNGLNGLEIFLGYPCNQKCLFCFQKDLRKTNNKFLEFDYVISLIDNGFSQGKRSIIFSGGESTMDFNLINYISYCKKKGFLDIRVHSNGIYFSNKENLYKYYDAGMTGIIISIHGYGKIHDYLVKLGGAFDLLKKTFLNLSELKKKDNNFVIDTNTVLTKYNYKNIYILAKFLSYFPITRIQIVQLYSLYLFNFNEKKSLYVSYENFSSEVEKIIDCSSNITFENFPLCKVDNIYWDYIIKRQKYDNNSYGTINYGFEETDCIYLDGCDKCEYKNLCTGIPKNYLEVFSEEKFIL